MQQDTSSNLKGREGDSFYKILNVSESATPQEIKTAYKNLVLIHHPDKGGNEKIFSEIQNAYLCLKDEEQRKKYDSKQNNDLNPFNFPQKPKPNSQPTHQQQPHQPHQPHQPQQPPHQAPHPPHQTPHPHQQQPPQQQPPQQPHQPHQAPHPHQPHQPHQAPQTIPKHSQTTQHQAHNLINRHQTLNTQNQHNTQQHLLQIEKLDIKCHVDISYKEMYNHKPIFIKYSRLILCSECEGLGKISESYEPCIVCNCSGKLSKVIYKYGKEEILSALCFRCSGAGYLFSGDNWCDTNCFVCDGSGLNKKITEHIIPYNEYMNNNSIRLSGLGNTCRIGENIYTGSLIVDICESDKTEDLYRNGYDLCIKQYVSIYDCMIGGSFTHKHLFTDKEITIKLAKITDDQGVIKRSLLMQKIKSQGFHDKLTNKMGDLVIEVCIVCPDIADIETKDILKKISGESLKTDDADFEATVSKTI